MARLNNKTDSCLRKLKVKGIFKLRNEKVMSKFNSNSLKQQKNNVTKSSTPH